MRIARKKPTEAQEEPNGQLAEQLSRIVAWTDQKPPAPERRAPAEDADDAASSAA